MKPKEDVLEGGDTKLSLKECKKSYVRVYQGGENITSQIHNEQRHKGKLLHGVQKTIKAVHCSWKLVSGTVLIYQETKTLKLALQWILILRDF